jgi:hypothetical protein
MASTKKERKKERKKYAKSSKDQIVITATQKTINNSYRQKLQ